MRTFTSRGIDVQAKFQRLCSLVPGSDTGGAAISEQQMTESNITRILLFSIMNGFASLDDILIKGFLPWLRGLGFFETSFIKMIQEAPIHVSGTFFDNLFKAAIETGDEQTVRLLLRHQLVDLHNIFCFMWGKRYTPVERAACLQAPAHGLIRTLIEYDADIGDALYQLLDSHIPRFQFSSRKFNSIPPTLLETVQLLIEKGSKDLLPALLLILNCCSITYVDEVSYMISQAIAMTDHRRFFKGKHDSGTPYGNWETAVVQIAKSSNAQASKSIIEFMVRTCNSHGGGCLAEFSDIMECAAIGAALKGRLEAVEILIEFATSTDLILSASIRSGNSGLIDLVLQHKPNLDPPARDLEHPEYEMVLTTPLCEAVRAGNNDMISLLESSGVLTSLATDGARLEAVVCAAAESGNTGYLRRLLTIASSTKTKYKVSNKALGLALEYGREEAAHLLIKEAGHSRSETTSPLSDALNYGSEEMIEAILDTDLYSTCMDKYAVQALLEFASLSVWESVLFVMPGMAIQSDIKWSDSLSQFYERCMETDSFDCFRKRLESISSKNWHLERCLTIAIWSKDHTMTRYLLQSGANPFNHDVLEAAMTHQPEMLSTLLGNGRQEEQQVRAPPKCVGAWHLALLLNKDSENHEALDGLLALGAVNLIVPEDVFLDDQRRCVTPLGLALLQIWGKCSSNLAIARKFLEAGADPNITARLERDPYRCVTGLMVALESGREDLVTLIVENGADVNLQPRLSLRRTPLQYAAELGNLDMVHLLISMGARVDSPAAFQGGGTALQFAAISGNCNIAAELLKQGASLSALPSKLDGRWPLEGAAEQGRLDMVQFLWNARELSLDNAGFEKRQCLRAMDFAQENRHFRCRDFVAELSGLSVEMLQTEEYGVPWLAY